MLGKLSWDAIPYDPIVLTAVGGGGLAILGVMIAITYFKKWGYLWREWLTSVDHKKNRCDVYRGGAGDVVTRLCRRNIHAHPTGHRT